MRVTFNSDFQSAMADLQRANSDLLKWQRQVSSGKRIQSASDDPTASADAVFQKAQIGGIDYYMKATDSVDSRLSLVDTVLSDVVTQLTSAKTTVAAVMGTVASQTQREAAARDLQGIKDALLSDVSQVFRGSYLFSGSAADTSPYARQADGTVTPYQGDSNTVSVDIDANRSVQVTFDGSALFKGDDTTDVFTSLDRLITAVTDGDQQAMSDGLAGLGRAFDRAVNMQSGVGMSLESLENQKSRLTALKQATTARLSEDQDANMAEAISNMSRADTAYQATLGAIGARSKLSLLDYLR